MAHDLIGKRFGRVVAVSRDTSRGKRKAAYWLLKCDCGGSTTASTGDIRRGAINSCGCLRRDLATARATHGESVQRTLEYRVWCSMKQRALSSTHKDYPRYGGRGIGVAEEFLTYKGFLASMGRCPEGMSLERVDNDGPYSVENCVWAPQLAQANNKRNNKVLCFEGEIKTLAEWGRDPRCVIPYRVLKSRVGRQGWALEDALRTPLQPKNWMLGKRQGHFKEI